MESTMWLDTIKSVVSPEYRSFVDHLEHDLRVGELVLIYSWPSVEERNKTNEMDLYLPSHLAVGNDSGDSEFLIRRDGLPTVYQCDAGSLGSVDPTEIHSDFKAWVKVGCPIPEDDVDLPLPLQSSIWLLRSPDEGLKGMFELRKLLGASWPSSELRSMMDSVPALLVRDGYPFAISRMLEDRPDYLACLGCGDSPKSIVPLATKT